MENYSHPDIYDILQVEGNSECVDCGDKNPKWASMNNGVFLCLKCAGVHRSFGMNISFIRSLQIDSWTDNQLLFFTKGGNAKFKKNLEEFNIDLSSSLDIKYKSKAADYYRRYLKNEVDRECDSNYVPTQIIKPELNVAQEIIEIKEENKEEKNTETEQKKEKKIARSFMGFMSSVLNKVKDGTTGAAKKVEKGFTDMKLGEKFKVAGNAIAGAAKTSGHFIADKTQKAVNSEFVQNISKKTKQGMNSVVERTKSLIKKDNKQNENEESRTEVSVKKEEDEASSQENKEPNQENKEEEKKDDKEIKEPSENSSPENNMEGNKAVPEEKVVQVPEENLEAVPEGGNENS